nr:unnamed protein product [Callosobruchus analis]
MIQLMQLNSPTVWLLNSLAAYSLISKLIFDNIYLTSKMVVDEEFHVPLGKAYCNFNFSVWDPKVTTLPGLYLTSSLLLGPLGLCQLYYLRFTSLLASFVNILLIQILFTKYNPEGKWTNIGSSFTLALLPPLYLCSHLYYTDIVSLTMILLVIVMYEKDHHLCASVFGCLAVVCRQTNIIWVLFVAGQFSLKALYITIVPKQNKCESFDMNGLIVVLKELMKNPVKLTIHTYLRFWKSITSYLAVGVAFLIFLFINGGIVVGDRTAHEATIHLPQLFYFSLFCFIFLWPYFVSQALDFFNFVKVHRVLTAVFLIIALAIVHSNTLVHPYMLADNRHYIFYIWNRFYGKYALFKYLMVPVYIFCLYIIAKIIQDSGDAIYLLMYLVCVFVVLVTQKLIEVRYYFIPYILLRLKMGNRSPVSTFCLILEFLTTVFINVLTLRLFFTKTIIWSNYVDPQRLIW